MTQGIPPVPVRAQIVDRVGRPTRALTEFLQGLRLALGGDTATVSPSTQADVLAPVGLSVAARSMLWPVAVFSQGSDVAPVSVAADGNRLDPVCGCMAGGEGMEPV